MELVESSQVLGLAIKHEPQKLSSTQRGFAIRGVAVAGSTTC